MLTHATFLIPEPLTALRFTKLSDSYLFLVDQELLDLLGYSSTRSVSKRYGTISIGRKPHITTTTFISALLNSSATSHIAESLIMSYTPLIERLNDAWRTP